MGNNVLYFKDYDGEVYEVFFKYFHVCRRVDRLNNTHYYHVSLQTYADPDEPSFYILEGDSDDYIIYKDVKYKGPDLDKLVLVYRNENIEKTLNQLD